LRHPLSPSDPSKYSGRVEKNGWCSSVPGMGVSLVPKTGKTTEEQELGRTRGGGKGQDMDFHQEGKSKHPC